jgi:methionyl aminopeptidase
MLIHVKNPKEITQMRVACQMAADTLSLVGDLICEGMTGEDIDRIVREDTAKKGGICAPLNYKGFPKSVCVSVNNVICHGIPDNLPFKNGDIVNVDITTIFNGWHGDTNATFYIGTPSENAKLVVETAREAIVRGATEIREGKRLGDIGAAIQEYVESKGCSVVRDYVGHGIGRVFHEPPNVPHYGSRGAGIRLVAGMTFTIEPMVNFGKYETILDQNDKWTVRTVDGSLSAQFEHTFLVKKDGCEILTARSRPLNNSENFSILTPELKTESKEHEITENC